MAVEESFDFILRFSFFHFPVCSFTTNCLIGRYLPSRGDRRGLGFVAHLSREGRMYGLRHKDPL